MLSTAMHLGIIIGLLVLIPFAPHLFSVQAFALRIIVTIACGLVAISIVTLSFVRLSELWLHT